MKLKLVVPMLAILISHATSAQTLPPPRELPEELIQQFADGVHDEIGNLPPELLRELRDMVDEEERAKADRYDYAEPRISNEVISNAPGTPIPKLMLGTNYNTYITFKDEAGNPWPVEHSNVGDRGAYTLNRVNEFTFEVEVTEPNVYSNLTFLLKGYDGPIMINVGPPEHYIDYVKNYTLQGLSPDTAARSRAASARAARTNDQPSVDRAMSRFLDGVPPEGAVPVSVIRGAQNDMWIYDDRLIVRTQMRLTSPAADSEPLYGSNGWRVYSLRNPNSILTFFHNRETVMTFISESAISELRQ